MVDSLHSLPFSGNCRKEKVFTENNKLFVEGHSIRDDEAIEYVHKGLASRDFTRVWTISDEILV